MFTFIFGSPMLTCTHKLSYVSHGGGGGGLGCVGVLVRFSRSKSDFEIFPILVLCCFGFARDAINI